jgi:hypothetical protein
MCKDAGVGVLAAHVSLCTLCANPRPLRCLQLRTPANGDKEAPKTFTFDQVYDWNSQQAAVFDITAKPIVEACMDGYNGAARQGRQPCGVVGA